MGHWGNKGTGPSGKVRSAAALMGGGWGSHMHSGKSLHASQFNNGANPLDKSNTPWEWILFVSTKFRAGVTPAYPWDQPVLSSWEPSYQVHLPLLLDS